MKTEEDKNNSSLLFFPLFQFIIYFLQLRRHISPNATLHCWQCECLFLENIVFFKLYYNYLNFMIIFHFSTFCCYLLSAVAVTYISSRYTALLVVRTFITERSCKSSISTTHHLRSSFASSCTLKFNFFKGLCNGFHTKL